MCVEASSGLGIGTNSAERLEANDETERAQMETYGVVEASTCMPVAVCED